MTRLAVAAGWHAIRDADVGPLTAQKPAKKKPVKDDFIDDEDEDEQVSCLTCHSLVE